MERIVADHPKKNTRWILIGSGAVIVLALIYSVLPKGRPMLDSRNAPVPAAQPAPAASQAVQPAAEIQPPAVPAVQRKPILRMAGSNTIGAELAPALAREYLLSLGATRIERRKVAEDEFSIDAVLNDEPVAIAIAAHGSGTAFKGLAAKSAEIGNASRPINVAELRAVSWTDVSRDPGSEFVIGMDGLAIVVNKNIGIEALTVEQLGKLFAGAASWADVGGPESCKTVGLYARDNNSGTWDVFNELVLKAGTVPLKLSSAAKRFEDSWALSDSVAGDPCGIGFIGLPYVKDNRLILVQATARPVRPTLFTVRTEVYPLSRRLYMYAPKFSPNPDVPKFLKFVQSPAGQKVVEEIGFISNDIAPPEPAELPPMDPRYTKAFAGMKPHQPLSTAIAFTQGADELDAKAYADLAALEQIIQRKEIAAEELVLIGHSDSNGTRAEKCDLSIQRAQVVAKEIAKLGLAAAEVAGFCDDVPVAPNDTEEGRQKNRRVEIWVPAVKS
jgi:phosphate transport system substrate-binding protein